MGYFGSILGSDFFSSYFSVSSDTPIVETNLGYFGSIQGSAYFSGYFSKEVSGEPVVETNLGYFGNNLGGYYFSSYFSKETTDGSELTLCGTIIDGAIQFGSIITSTICGRWST